MISKTHYFASLVLACISASPALAQDEEEEGRSGSSLQAVAETREYSDDLGSLRTLRIEYQNVSDAVTFTLAPAVGERRGPLGKDTSVGAGAVLDLKLTKGLYSRTSGFVSEDKPVFAKYDVAQDVLFNVTRTTVVTLGGRWVRHFGNQDLTYVNAGVRQYFKGGSLAYRYSRVDPEGVTDSYSAHLVNLTLNDGNGPGKTQLWGAYGDTNPDLFDPALTFSGHDYGFNLRRIQPVGGNLSLVGMVGYTSYDRPAGRISAVNVGLGARVDFD